MAVGVSMAEFLRVALELPEVELREWEGHRVLQVRGKFFSYLSEADDVVLLKAMLQEQAALVEHDPSVFSASHTSFSESHTSGRFGWVEIRLARVRPDELVELIDEAWSLSAPKKLVIARRKSKQQP